MKQTFVWDHAVSGYNDAQNFDLNRQMRQELIDARRWAKAWKAKAKELRRDNKKLAEFKMQQCSTCAKYWGCKWAYHLDGCSEWEPHNER